MRVYKAIRTVYYSMGLVKKGDRVFQAGGGYKFPVYLPENGGYGITANSIEDCPDFEQIPDLPYSPAYYIKKRQIKHLKREIKNEEEKWVIEHGLITT